MNTFRRKKRKTKPAKTNPEQQMMFDELYETMNKLGIEVRIEPGHFKGGFCLLEEQQLFFLNKNQPIQQNIDLLISQLKSMDVGHIFLSPRIRFKLEENGLNIEGSP